MPGKKHQHDKQNTDLKEASKRGVNIIETSKQYNKNDLNST